MSLSVFEVQFTLNTIANVITYFFAEKLIFSGTCRGWLCIIVAAGRQPGKPPLIGATGSLYALSLQTHLSQQLYYSLLSIKPPSRPSESSTHHDLASIMAQDPRALLQKVRPHQLGVYAEDTPPNALQADKALSSAGGGFSFFGGRSDKYEGAVDIYIQAANAFRMQKMGKIKETCPAGGGRGAGMRSVLTGSRRTRGRADL